MPRSGGCYVLLRSTPVHFWRAHRFPAQDLAFDGTHPARRSLLRPPQQRPLQHPRQARARRAIQTLLATRINQNQQKREAPLPQARRQESVLVQLLVRYSCYVLDAAAAEG